MRAMGLDVGTKTVGVAISDELGFTAQPVMTLHRTNIKADLATLKALVQEHAITHVVVGLPRNMDGTEGPRAAATRRFAHSLEDVGTPAADFWDERLSTVAVQRVLIEADLSREKRKGVIDKVAAVYILQGWLDAHRAPSENEDSGF